MPAVRSRLTLLAVLAGGLALMHLTPGTTDRVLPPPQWPAADSTYHVDGWQLQPAVIESGTNDDQSLGIIQRTYQRPGQPSATLVIWTQPEPQAKTLLRKGADRDFLGDGYVSESIPDGLLSPHPGHGAFIARRGADAWLVLYAYGERRGLLDMGPLAWGFAELDALLDQPNDYFLARIMVPFHGADQPPVAAAGTLADVLFPRLESWYEQLHQPHTAAAPRANA